MVERKTRAQAAKLVEDFCGGRITNMQLIEAWPSSADSGVSAIEDFLWPFYDDFKEHFIDEELRAAAEFRRRIALCMRFLRSDEPYTWPCYGTIPGVFTAPRWAVLASFGLLSFWNRFSASREERYWSEMRAHGDLDAWPFWRKRSG